MFVSTSIFNSTKIFLFKQQQIPLRIVLVVDLLEIADFVSARNKIF